MPYTSDWIQENLTREQLDQLSGATVLEFGADWCPHCQAVQTELRRSLEERPGIRHLKFEDGKGRPLGRSFRVKLWPNFVLLKDGEVMQQLARPEPGQLTAEIAKLA
jgi:thioredoxin 1